ncbi:transcriptional repressor TCF25-domain-containing protein [Pelagophyceae sp. CCMP2097]|nr:transcriptional repressor TCF25-domain-containing protein [Pelagophyceae sp. CCMP2097]
MWSLSKFEEDDDEVEEATQPASSGFAAFGDSSDDESSADEDARPAAAPEAAAAAKPAAAVAAKPVAAAKKSKGKKKKGKGKGPRPADSGAGDMELLEAAVAAQRADASAAAGAALPRFLLNRVDAQREVDARFGVGGGGGAQTKTHTRRYVFGPPPRGFGDAPTFARGGLRWSKCAAPARGDGGGEWWTAAPSDRYAARTQELRSSFGDANELARLAARAPFHAPTLVTLARACAKLGQRAHCAPLLRRALNAYDAAAPRYEALADAVLRGAWRVDAGEPEHVALFAALQRTARQAAMLGAPETAANLFGALLSLDPLGDPCFVLLRLDADFVAAQRFQDALDLYDTPVGVGCGVRPADGAVELFEDAQPAAVLDGGALADSRAMPGICLNRGLCLLRLGRDRTQAVEAVADCLASFPHLLVCMLEACGVDAERDCCTEYDFRELLWHDQFRKLTHSTWQKRSYQLGALPRALDACCLRSRSLWKQPDALRLLHDGAAALVLRLGAGKAAEAALQQADADWSLSALVKYVGAPINEFKDAYESLGPEAAVGFDEALLSPEAAARAAHDDEGVVLRRDDRGRGGRDDAQPAGGARRGGGARDSALDDLVQQLPEDLRAHVLEQARSGVPLEEIQAAIFSLFD